jgi:PIN domain nuclease of toxin-antitoxin system
MTRIERSALLLDTHAWTGSTRGLPELSEQLRQAVDDAARRGEVWVSVISPGEVSMLCSKHRLHLERSCLDSVQRALAPPARLGVAHRQDRGRVQQMPGRFHNDPADRIITATAPVETLTVVTRDRQILDYAAEGYVSALAC